MLAPPLLLLLLLLFLRIICVTEVMLLKKRDFSFAVAIAALGSRKALLKLIVFTTSAAVAITAFPFSALQTEENVISFLQLF